MANRILKTFIGNSKLSSAVHPTLVGAFANRHQQQQQQKFRFFSSSDRAIRSKLPPLSIPDVSLEDLVLKDVDRFREKVALECAETGRKYTFAEMIAKSNALSRFLDNFPTLKAEDTVAIVLPNVPEYFIAILGVMQAGLTITTVNPSYTAEEIAKQLVDSKAKMVFTLDEACPNVKQAVILAKSNATIVGIKHNSGQSLPEGVVDFHELVAATKGGEQGFVRRHIRRPHDVIILPYSSGTTGMPKGVEITNRNFLSSLLQVDSPEFRLARPAEGSYQDVHLAVLPMFHIFGMVVNFRCLAYGCKVVMVPKFSSDIFYRTLTTDRPRFLYAVPPMLLLLINNPKFHPCIHTVETILSGAAPLGASEVNKISQVSQGKTTVIQGYGMTETTAVVSHQSKLIDAGIKPGGCGFIVSSTECKVVALDGHETKVLGPNESGEILVRGPQIMKGYYRNEKANEDIFREDGWMKTGDIGHYDEDQHLFVTDRIKELIKVQGFQVAPAELEEVLRKHPDVADAAVIGVPHKKLGEVAKAFVVLKKGKAFSATCIQDFVSSQVVNYKQLLGGVVQLDAIPKTASGKLLRKVLKTL